MSRALDEKTKEAIKHGDHAKVFDDIATALSPSTNTLLEIELLGQSHQLAPDVALLQDGSCIAIPKIRLVQAFVFARRAFTDHVRGDKECSDERLRKATAVMLLMDPEHLTAANTRKRLLMNSPASARETAEILRKEKLFVDSLLTSRLHRHTKSPVLWNHRRWLMGRFGTCAVTFDAAKDLRSVVLVSAERHGRNYYAWSHGRQLVSLHPHDASTALLDEVKKWCFGHHDDVSGWMFALFLLRRFPEEAASLFDETLRLAETFHWRNESVWYFLRNLLMSGLVEGAAEKRFRSVREGLQQDARDRNAKGKVLEQALHWITSYPAELVVPRQDAEG
ncbi:hypothetical protein RJ55_02268 [Drechmeria coniospora]|nr:hypothetical protein RJ55_02268 [Drechmeria coniospora]